VNHRDKLFIWVACNKLSLEEANVEKKLLIVLSVILTLTLLLTSVAFAAGGNKDVALAQEAGQAWLDRTVALSGEPLEWVGAHLTTPQVCYDLKGKPNAYTFAIENNGEVVGYMIVGSSAYGYPMFETADVPAPAIPSADEVKSILASDLGLKVEKIGNPTRLLYLGFDNLYAVYQAGRQEVAVNLKFDFAVPASNLTAAMPLPEDYKANKEATTETKPEQLESNSSQSLVMPQGLVMLVAKYLTMSPYCGGGWCGPSSGVSIGQYYKTQVDRNGDGIKDYRLLPSSSVMYDRLNWFMSLRVGPVLPPQYGPGFFAMTLEAGYNNFKYATDLIVTGGDYWNRVADINSGWPIALMSLLFNYPGRPSGGHWVAIRGYLYYQYSGEPIQTWVRCTDSYVCSDTVWIDWNNIGLPPVATVTIKDS
jgi:hypothetical protein